MNQEKMGSFIAQCRKELHLTQLQLGDELGVTDKTVSKWENGTNAPNIALLNQLSEILHVSTKELLNGERDLNPISNNTDDLDIASVIKYYNDIDRKKAHRKAMLIILAITLFAISIILFLLLKSNYDNCYIYQIESVDNGIDINGLLIMTDEKDILSINSISNLSRYDLDRKYGVLFEYSLMSYDTEIQKIGDLSLYNSKKDYSPISLNQAFNNVNFYIVEKSNYNLLLNDGILNDNALTIKFKYIDENGIENVIVIPLKVNQAFANNKFIYEGGRQF